MKPTLVIIHGSWHVPQHFASFTRKLHERKFEVFAPLLPSCSSNAGQMGFNDDVQVVRDLVTSLADASKHTIVIAHSYGGAVASDALLGLSVGERQAGGQPGGVVQLVYVCAFMLQPGQSPRAVNPPPPGAAPTAQMFADGTSFPLREAKQLFFADVENHIAEENEKLLVRNNAMASTEPIKHAAWRLIPTMYIECTQDQAVRIERQRQFIQSARDTGVEVEVETYESSHSPYLSKTEELVASIQKVADRYT